MIGLRHLHKSWVWVCIGLWVENSLTQLRVHSIGFNLFDGTLRLEKASDNNLECLFEYELLPCLTHEKQTSPQMLTVLASDYHRQGLWLDSSQLKYLTSRLFPRRLVYPEAYFGLTRVVYAVFELVHGPWNLA